ncbi:MAG: YcbK family protein [Ignavibacteriaceae bacterium]
MLKTLLQKHNITNFTEGEILHGNNIEDIPNELIQNIFPTLKILQLIRTDINIPVSINSSFRTPQHNAAIGGSPGSLHLYFNAIDFSVKGFTAANYSHLAYRINARSYVTSIEFQEENRILTPNIMGIGLYPNFIHIDTRGLLNLKAPARWGI